MGLNDANHGKSGRGGDKQPNEKAHENGQDDAYRVQGEPEDDEDREHRQRAVQLRPLLQGRELVVGNRYGAGEAHGHALLLELEAVRRRVDRIRRVLARLQRVEIEERVDLDECPSLAPGRRLAAQKLAPAEIGGAACQRGFDGRRQRVELGGEAVERNPPQLHAAKRQGEGAPSRREGSDRPQAAQGTSLTS